MIVAWGCVVWWVYCCICDNGGAGEYKKQVRMDVVQKHGVKNNISPCHCHIPLPIMYIWRPSGRLGFVVGMGDVVDSATKHRGSSENMQVSQYIKENMLIKCISHLQIAAPPRHWCIKEDVGVGCGEGGRWQLWLMVPRGCTLLTRRWDLWITKSLFNKSINIYSPCCFCILSPMVLPWGVCNYFGLLQFL